MTVQVDLQFTVLTLMMLELLAKSVSCWISGNPKYTMTTYEESITMGLDDHIL